MTAMVEGGVTPVGMTRIWQMTTVLGALYLLRIAFRFGSTYLSGKAALGQHLAFFHDKQTGDLMGDTGATSTPALCRS